MLLPHLNKISHRDIIIKAAGAQICSTHLNTRSGTHPKPRDTGRALEIFDVARTLGDGNPLVFPMRSGRPISASTLPKMLQYHRIAAVAHGFRSSFRDWAAEETDHPREVIEAARAHVVPNKVEAAYARSDLFERRRRLMDDWATYLDGVRRGRPATPQSSGGLSLLHDK